MSPAPRGRGAHAAATCIQSHELSASPTVVGQQRLADGVSLYMAELARAEELARVAAGGEDVVILIDEPFRGTNNDESTAAAAGLLSFLAKRCLVLVSSHNLVLAQLLAKHLTPWRVVSRAPGVPRLRLEPGLLVDTNGLRMLKQYNFDAEVSTNAVRVLRWLSDAGTHRSHVPEL